MYDRSKKKNKQIAMAILIFIFLAIVIFPFMGLELSLVGEGGMNLLNFIIVIATIWISLGFHWRKFA